MTKSAWLKISIQQSEWPILVFEKVLWTKFALWHCLSTSEWLWLATVGDFSGSISKGLVWYTHWTQLQTLQWESLRAQHWPKRVHYLNKAVKFLWAISKQLQVPRSTVQTTVWKYKVYGTVVSLSWSGRKQKCLLIREKWSGWSRVNKKPTKRKAAMN